MLFGEECVQRDMPARSSDRYNAIISCRANLEGLGQGSDELHREPPHLPRVATKQFRTVSPCNGTSRTQWFAGAGVGRRVHYNPEQA